MDDAKKKEKNSRVRILMNSFCSRKIQCCYAKKNSVPDELIKGNERTRGRKKKTQSFFKKRKKNKRADNTVALLFFVTILLLLFFNPSVYALLIRSESTKLVG